MYGASCEHSEPTEGPEQHHVPSLPLDVIALVFDCLREEVHHFPTDPMEPRSGVDAVKAILRIGYSCCLVSHAFLPHGRNLLYSHLGLGQLESSARQLEAVLKTAHLARVAEVWEINLAEDYDFVEVAQLLHRLHTISFDVGQVPENLEASVGVQSHLNRLASPPAALQDRLRCLRLRPAAGLPFNAICAAISAYPKLETLSIAMAMSDVPVAATFAPSHLRLLDVSWCDKNLVTALLIASPNLEILEIRYSAFFEPPSGESESLPAPSSLRDINLRTLVVRRVFPTAEDPTLAPAQISADEYGDLFAFISTLSSLTTLEILETSDNTSTKRRSPPAIETCHDLVRTFPNSIENLHISGPYLYAIGLSLGSILLTSPASIDPGLAKDEPALLPRLKKLGVSWPLEYRVKPCKWLSVLQACDDRKVEVNGSLTDAHERRKAQLVQLGDSWVREDAERWSMIGWVLFFVSGLLRAAIITYLLKSLRTLITMDVIWVLLMYLHLTSYRWHVLVMNFFYGSIDDACQLAMDMFDQ
ncbi:hypothetical protein RQP46_002656 [Phenoliferia psychrophenolica]